MSDQIVITSVIFPLNFQGRMVNSMSAAQRFKLRLEDLVIPYTRMLSKINGILSKRHRSQSKRTPTAKVC